MRPAPGEGAPEPLAGEGGTQLPHPGVSLRRGPHYAAAGWRRVEAGSTRVAAIRSSPAPSRAPCLFSLSEKQHGSFVVFQMLLEAE